MKIFGKNIVGLDFNDYSAQAVELKSVGGEIHLKAYNRILLPPNIINNGEIFNSEELKYLLKGLLAKANPKSITCKNVAVIFPSRKIFSHIFTFPKALSPEEIIQSLSYEAEKIIPFSIQEVYWDYNILPTKNEVLFVAIEKRIADRYVDLLQAMELNPLIFGTDVETLQYGLKKQLNPSKNSLILDIGTLSSNYLIIKNGILKSFFSSTKGGRHIIKTISENFSISEKDLLYQKEKSKIDKKYLPEINKFIEMNHDVTKEFVEKDKINDIYLTGEFLSLPGFYETTKKFFPNKNIFIGDPKKSLYIDPNKFKTTDNEKALSFYSTHFINAVGVAMQCFQKSKKGINILPDALKENVKNKKRNIFFVLSSIFMCAILLFLATFIFFKHQDYIYQRKLMEIEKSSIDKMLYGRKYQEILRGINSFNNEVDAIFNIESRLFSIYNLIREINSELNTSIQLNRINFSDSNLTVDLSGVAPNRNSLLKITQEFNDLDFVSEVRTPLSSYDLQKDISFTMSLNLIFKQLPSYGNYANT